MRKSSFTMFAIIVGLTIATVVGFVFIMSFGHRSFYLAIVIHNKSRTQQNVLIESNVPRISSQLPPKTRVKPFQTFTASRISVAPRKDDTLIFKVNGMKKEIKVYQKDAEQGNFKGDTEKTITLEIREQKLICYTN